MSEFMQPDKSSSHRQSILIYRMKHLGVLLLPLDLILVHHRLLPSIFSLVDPNAKLPVYARWVERDTVTVKCFA